MPAGFAGVTYMGLVLFVFLGLFVAVAVMEESLTINLLVLSLFWFSMCVFHVLNPGTAPGRWQRIVDGLLTISSLAAVHLVIQLALSFALRNVRVGLQHGVAAEQVTVSSSNSVDLVN